MRGNIAEREHRHAARVALVHRQTAVGLGVCVAFLVASAATLILAGARGRWAALHLLLAGGVLNAIAVATIMLAVTWATASPPRDATAWATRGLLACGPVAVVVGREAGWLPLLTAGAAATAAGLLVVAGSLLGIRARATLDRFHPAIDAYVAAALFGGAGAILGAIVASGRPASSWAAWRAAHLTLNLTGFVGLVIAGTLPYFVATQARMKMNPRATPARVRAALVAFAAATVVAALARAGNRAGVATAALVAQAIALAVVGVLLPRPGRKQWAWAGPRLVHLALGVLWWIGTTVWWAVVVGRGGDESPVLAVLAVGGFAQILVAGLAYLGPVVRAGGGDRLRDGFTTTGSWLGIVAANVAAIALVASARLLATVALGTWALDSAVRALRLGVRRRPAPTTVSGARTSSASDRARAGRTPR